MSSHSDYYVVLPLPLLTAPMAALRAYLTLRSYLNPADPGQEVFPSRRTMADRAEVSIDTIDRGIKWLADEGWVTVIERHDEAGDRTSNAYIVFGAKQGVAAGLHPRVAADLRPRVAAEVVEEVEPLEVEPKTLGDASPLTEFSLLPASVTARRVEKAKADRGYAFDEWWAIVPKKVDKGHAERAYRKALTKTTHERLMQATRDLVGWNALGPRQYIPNPATWLNGERWNDEVVPESKAQKPRDLSAAWIKQDFGDPFAGLA
jgi:hypothetical protein